MNHIGLDIYSNENIIDQRHASFFQTVATGDNSIINVNSGIYLMAWIDDEISVPVSLQDQASNTTDTLLYFEKLSPALEIAPGALMLTSSIYSWNSSLGGNNTITTSYYNLPSGGYEIRFQPSLPVHFNKVNSLRLTIGSNTTPDKIQTSLWNFKTKTWDRITLDSYETDIPEASQYVGMDGEILMIITGDPNDYFEIISIDFILMVQP
jgi:hypothetical protein